MKLQIADFRLQIEKFKLRFNLQFNLQSAI